MIKENPPSNAFFNALFFGAKSRLCKCSAKRLLAGLLLCAFASTNAVPAFAMPAGFTVESGDVTFDQSNPGILLINASDRAIINFDSFSIAQGETVRFVQPIDSASVLGRVTGGFQSDIWGSLFANGEFVFVNTNGIHFHEGANVQVGSLVVSTLGIDSAAYLASQYRFEKAPDSEIGRILNEADIRVRDGGHIALVAERIQNTGHLTANLGSVALGTGEKATLSFDEAGLITLVIDRGLSRELVENSLGIDNSGTLAADGGRVVLTAATLDEAYVTLVNNEGVIQAGSVVERDGEVVFAAGGGIEQNGRVTATHVKIGEGTTVEANDSDFTVEGNWTNDGTFLGENSSVELVGSRRSEVRGDNAFHDLSIRVPGKTVAFEAGKTQTIDGTLKAEGAYGQHVKLISTEAGARWKVDPSGARDVSYAWVEDMDNVNAVELFMRESTNRGNSVNVDPTGTWTNGDGDSLWSNAANWSGLGGATPGAGDDVVFSGIGSSDSIVDASFGGTVGSLSLNAGYANRLSLGRSLTVTTASGRSGNVTLNAGTFDLEGFDLTTQGFTQSAGILELFGSENVSFTTSPTLSGGTWRYTGDGDGAADVFTIKEFGGIDYSTLAIQGVDLGDSFILGADLQVESLTTAAGGSLSANGNDITVTGTMTMNSEGAFLAGAGNTHTFGGITVLSDTSTFNGGSSTITVTGDVSLLDGTFISTSGDLYIEGDIITGSSTTFTHNGGAVHMSGTNQLVQGEFVFHNFSKVAAGGGEVLSFTTLPGFDATVEGLLELRGTPGNLLTLQRSGAGQWHIDPQGTRFIQFVSVSDSANDNVTAISAVSSTDGGGNTGWSFGGATTFTWSGAVSSNWSVGGNWDIGTAPTNTDNAIIANVATDPLLTQNTTIGNLTVNTGGVLDLNGFNFTVSGALSNSGTLRLEGGETVSATMDTDSGTVIYDGSPGAADLAAGYNYFNLSFAGSGTWNNLAALDVNGDLSIAASNSLVSNNTAVNVGGNWTNAGGYVAVNNTVTFDGTGTQTVITGGTGALQDFNNVTVNKTAGSVLLSTNAMDIDGNFTISNATSVLDLADQALTVAGTFSNNGTLRLLGTTSGALTMDTDSGTVLYYGNGYPGLVLGYLYNNLTFAGNGSWTQSAALDVNGNLTIGATDSLESNDNDVNVAGNWTNAGGYVSGANAVTFDGGGAQTLITGGTGATQDFNNLVVSKSAGTLTVSTNALDIDGALTVSAGTLDADTRAVTVGGLTTVSGGTYLGGSALQTFGNGLLVTAGAMIGETGTLDFNGTVVVEGGTLTASSGTTTAAADWRIQSATGGTFQHNSGTLVFDGVGAQGWATGGIGAGFAYNNVTVDKAGGTLTLGSAVIGGHLDATGQMNVLQGEYSAVNAGGYQTWASDLTVSGGTFTAGNQTVDVNDDLTLSSGTLTAASAGTAFTVGGDFTRSGGTFNHNSGTITLDGSNQTVSGSTAFNNLTKTVGTAATLTFAASSAQTVAGTLTFEGASGQLLSLRSSAGGSQWSIDPQGTRNVSFVDVRDSNNVNATLLSPANSTDSGNNTNWFTASGGSGGSGSGNTGTGNNGNNGGIEQLGGNQNNGGGNQSGEGEESEGGENAGEEEGGGEEGGSEGGGNSGNQNGGGFTSGLPGGNGGPADDQEKEGAPDRETFVFVDEGAVDVNSQMVYDGEAISVKKDGTTVVRMRAVYVTNMEGIKVYRAKIHTPMKEFKWKEGPSGLAATSKGTEVFSVTAKSKKIVALDTSNFISRDIYGLEEGSTQIVLSPDDTIAYVSNALNDTIQVVDVKSETVLRSFRTGTMPSQMVVTRDGKSLYVLNRLDKTVTRLSTADGRTEATFQGGDSPYGLAVSKDESTLFVSDSSAGRVLALDAKTGARTAEIPVGESPTALRLDPEGKTLFVSNRGSNSVSIVDTASFSETSRVEVGKMPAGLAIVPEGDKLYVANELSGNVSVVNVNQRRVVETIPSGIAPSQIVISSPQKPMKR